MPGPISTYLEDDHALIDRLLDDAVTNPDSFDHSAFERARARLLRHIGIEEKILLPDARHRRGERPLPIARLLRRDHGAIASLLVPTPDHALVGELRRILAAHNPLEEGPHGLYATCEELAGDEVGALLRRVVAAGEARPAKHFDGPRAIRTAVEALARSSAALGARPSTQDEDP